MRQSKPPPPEETLPHRTAGPKAPVVDVVVRPLDAKAQPAMFPLERTCRIGSAPDCDVVIADPTVSRAHAEFDPTADGIVVTDLGSRNGTFYLGQRIQKLVLSPGAVVQLGSVSVALDVDTGSLHVGLSYSGSHYHGMIGISSGMNRLYALLLRLEGSLAPVLVEGESGVGKEMVARALHEGSAVSGGPMVSLNCGALPRELVASELFGHRKGAFTGASETRKGAFETADGGTLFLDEIGELPLDLQPMLLRSLETGECRRVGDDTPCRVRVRVVAATNRDLATEARERRFREDLYYRLAVVRLEVPPLRHRLEDIAPLALHFAQEFGCTDVPPELIEQLKVRTWPGNIRELRNAMQTYAVLGVLPKVSRSTTETLELWLREMIDPRSAYAAQKDALVDRFTALYLQQLMETARGNQSVAARIAELDRGYLGRLLARHGLSKER